MSAAVSISTVASVVTAAAAVGSTAYALSQGGAKTPALQTPPTPPQAASTPDANGVLKNIQAGGAAPGGGGGPGGGVASTLLTGGKGIDPNDLSLGKSSLLGS